MSIPFSNTTQRIPAGFANLLEGLAREVLRSQPVDIPSFAAKYFETLLIEREKSGYDPCEWGAKIEDRFYNNHAFNELAPPGGGDKAEEKKEGSGAQPREASNRNIPSSSHHVHTVPSSNMREPREQIGEGGESVAQMEILVNTGL
ncbi:sperm surface protein Sp17 isoform X2 [Zootoca vivipara]|uniref:sperm surface protein Sp17 isoform X2 n=1 Tax=Zootoca vivipara TaxID=8524 RepID=UPI00293C1241|nr:sperm surface protein Sp17 isoform X2 [Zootoca vivipara]